MVENGTGVAALYHRLVVLHFLAEGGGGLSGQADDGVAVGPVVGDFEIHNGIVIADDQVDVLTYLAVFVIQNPDAVGVSAGQIVLGQSQLGEGAEHTVGQLPAELALGDVYAAGQPGIMKGSRHQIALMDVLGAGDDLDRLPLAHIYLADKHVVRVGVANHGKHLAHNYILNFGIHPLIGLHLLTEDGQGLYKFLVGNAA